ncbi:cytidylyltransferase domain-containing protein, partial [Staphylococcus aureus]|uniref:cytidylyltransferase domain-containing protein n=1 Tax=Staphylococcus aureus TaxID=1280 RepID=UPI003C6EF5DA
MIAADDCRVADFLDTQKIPYVMTSDKNVSGTDRIEEVATKKSWPDDDLIVNVQGDEPLVPFELLQSFVDFCCSRLDMEMATISCPIQGSHQLFDPNIVKV